MKNIMIIILLTICFFPKYVMADSNMTTRIGNKYYNSFLEAYNDAFNGDTITLLKNVKLEKTLLVNKDITINLNGSNIESDNSVIMVDGGHLKLVGKGSIRENNPNLYAVLLRGSNNSEDKDYSLVTVGKDVTLEGWSGIFIDWLGKDADVAGNSSYNSSYGVKAIIYGKLIGKQDDSDNNGIGLYINGNVKEQNNYPLVDIKDGALVESDGVGIYIAGYAKVNAGAARITGVESGVAIKSGVFTSDGTTVVGTGKEKKPSAYGNGINPTGAALQIESNKGYAGNMEIFINNSIYESKNASAIVEYMDSNVIETSVINMTVKDSEFITYNGKDKIVFSDSFKDKYGSIITEVQTFHEKSITQNVVINNSITKKILITIMASCIIVLAVTFIKKHVII